MLPNLTFENAQIIWPDGIAIGSVSVCNGLIELAGTDRHVNLSGYIIAPGIIDLHGDGFERHLAPRRGLNTDIAKSLGNIESELAANGITTAYLAQFWSWEGGIRGPDFARKLCRALAAYEAAIDMRVQLRIEFGCHEDFSAIAALIREHTIGYAVFNDSLPHDTLKAGKTPPRLAGQALKAGRSPEDHLAFLKKLHESMQTIEGALESFIASLPKAVILGSHDDKSEKDRARWHGLGARIAEFPISEAAALSAHAAGDAVILGAPNIVRGGSHSGNLSAADMIAKAACDALASDYHYPSLVQSAFRLSDEGMPLHRAWSYISEKPAALMGMSDRGRIAQGLRADLAILNERTRRIEGTISKGRFAFLSGALAERLIV